MPQQSHRSPVNEIQENSRGGVKQGFLLCQSTTKVMK